MQLSTLTSRRGALLASSIGLLASSAAAQGDTGFLRGKGKSDVVLSFTRDEYDEFWLGDDRMDAPGEGIERTSTTLYAAFGLRDDLDIVFSASEVEAETRDEMSFPSESDPQDAYFGAKWRFLGGGTDNHGFSLLVAPSVKLPMTDYEDNAVTAIGDGQVDLRGRLIAHYQCANGLYAALESGYDFRNGAPDDEIPFNLTVGGTYGPFTLSPFYSRVFSQGGPDIGDAGFTFPGVREEFERAGVSAYARLGGGFGLTGMWRTTIDGRNTGDADSVSIGVVMRF